MGSRVKTIFTGCTVIASGIGWGGLFHYKGLYDLERKENERWLIVYNRFRLDAETQLYEYYKENRDLKNENEKLKNAAVNE